MQIHGYNKLTLLDYPGHLASTIFLGGCNMRCPFCHNATLVLDPTSQPVIPIEEILSNLNKRKNMLEGVCVTGGEPTLYSDLPELIKEIKALGYKVKLDTNGTNPDMLKHLTESGQIDYVAMDIKNSREKYGLTSGIPDISPEVIDESISYLLSAPIDYEFRTTVVKELHTKEDMLSIGHWIKGAKAYYLQAFMDSGDIISPGFSSYSPEEMKEFASLLVPYVDHVSLRGID